MSMHAIYSKGVRRSTYQLTKYGVGERHILSTFCVWGQAPIQMRTHTPVRISFLRWYVRVRIHAYTREDMCLYAWGHILIRVRTYVYTHEDTCLYGWGHMLVCVRTHACMNLVFTPRGIFLNKAAWAPRDSAWVFLESGEPFPRRYPGGEILK